MAVPSFNRDSPIIKIVNLGEAPADLSNAGSVAAKIDPKTMQRFQLQSRDGRQRNTKEPIKKAPMMTPERRLVFQV
jgi:hypothetical protein